MDFDELLNFFKCYKALIMLFAPILVTPYLICVFLKFALWKYQFTSKPLSFLPTGYKDIMTRIPIGLNLYVLVSVQQVTFNLWPPVKIHITGLSINVLIKNEFHQWKNHQIELFKMLDDIRTRLKRGGLLSAQGAINVLMATQGVQDLSSHDDDMTVRMRTSIDPTTGNAGPQTAMSGVSSNNQNRRTQSASAMTDSQAGFIIQQQRTTPRQVRERTFIQRTLRNLLSSTLIELDSTDMNFYVYQEQSDLQSSSVVSMPRDDIQLDPFNIKKFHWVINSRQFLEKNLCFRLHFPKGEMKVNAISDEDLDLQIKASRCLLLNPCFQYKQGILEDISLLMKLPIQRKMLKYPGNYDISLKIKKAALDLNKKFIKKFASWFVNLYTLNRIIKVAKTIILKTTYQEQLLSTQNTTWMTYENYRDTMIPKRLKIQVLDGIDLIVTDECKSLKAFLQDVIDEVQFGSSQPFSQETSAGEHGHPSFSDLTRQSHEKKSQPSKTQQEFALIKLEKTTFWLERKIQNTYYIIIKAEKGDLQINKNIDALKIEGYTHEIDFTFRKEMTNLPVRKVRLLLHNKIQIERINCNLTASLLNFFLEVINVSKAMVWTSNIKSKINGMLLNEDFLKNNVLQIDPAKVGTDYERSILKLYKPLRYQDEIQMSFKLNNLKLRIDRQIRDGGRFSDPFANNFKADNSFGDAYRCSFGANTRAEAAKSQSQRNAEARVDLLKGLLMKMEGLNFSWSMAGGKINQNVSTQFLRVIPMLNKSSQAFRSQSSAQSMISLFLVGTKDLHFKSITHLSDVRRLKEIYLKAQKCQLNVNYEVYLDMSKELIDFSFIYQHFKTKWNSKYKVRENIPCDLIERQMAINDLTLNWNLSSQRFVNFTFKDLRTVNEYFQVGDTKYVEIGGKQRRMILNCKVREAFLIHYKFLANNVDEFYRCCFVPVEHEMIVGDGLLGSSKNDDSDLVKEQIIAAKEFRLRFESDEMSKKLDISAQQASMDLPDKYHFTAVIYEMQKQYYHGREWFKVKKEQRLEEINFRFKRWKKSDDSFCQNDLEKMAQQKMQAEHEQNSMASSLTVSIKVKDITFTVQENNLKKIFVDKSEVIDIMKEKRNFRVKQQPFSQLWHQIQQLNLNDKYMAVRGKKFLMQFDLPRSYKNKQHIMDVIKSLDEGRDYINAGTFKSFKPGVHTFKLDYGGLMARNMRKPIVELWRVHWTQTFIAAEVNPILNEKLFTTYTKNKIFQRFEMPKLFNKLLSKWYYDVNVDIHKLRVNIQGQHSLLFFNDIFQQLVSRFVYEDISRGRDPEKKYLKYLTGLDRTRARAHGKMKISVLNVLMSVYAQRNFKPDDHYFQIMWNDLIFHQVYRKWQICMRDFIIKKQPLKEFETIFVKLPIIELKYQVKYNDGKTINHFFNQQDVRTIEDWKDRVKSYIQKSQFVQIQLNIPTLGHRNEVKTKSLYLPFLLQSYVDHSPIPIIHYQRSHMKFFDQFQREFQANRIDISGKVYRKTQLNNIGINKRYTVNYLPQQLEKSKSKFQGYINDIIFIMSEFKEDHRLYQHDRSDSFGDLSQDDHILPPEEVQDHSKRDAYLERYNGVMITGENLCVKSEFTYQPNHVNYFEINDSLASFNLFKFSKMTSRHLFKIRHPCFNYHRNQQFEQSLDNYTMFCKYFEIDENKAFESSDQVIGKSYQHFVIPPVELLEQEMEITANRFYEKAYGPYSRIFYDASLKYKQLLGSFKTIFPKYILTNEQIQKQIQKIQSSEDNSYYNVGAGLAQNNSQQIDEARKQNRSTGLARAESGMMEEQELIDDFIFSENDTIGTVIHSEYRQDQRIQYTSIREQKRHKNSQNMGQQLNVGSKGTPLLNQTDRSRERPKKESQSNQDRILVKHLIDIRGVRFLYTKKILELIHQHFVKGFDFKQFRKTDYIDIKAENSDNKIFMNYDNSQANGRKPTDLNNNRIFNSKALQKEALVAIRLQQAQINFQNNLTESQMLIASPRPVICVIFAYYKNQAPSLLQNEQNEFYRKASMKNQQENTRTNEELNNHNNEEFEYDLIKDQEKVRSFNHSIYKREGIKRGFYKDPLNRDQFSLRAKTAEYTGYQFSSDRDVIKCLMEIGVREMDCYVAPTFINLENPTFWINQNYIENVGVSHHTSRQHREAARASSPTGRFRGSHQSASGYQNSRTNFDDFCDDQTSNINNEGENLLRKIIFVNDISFDFEFLKQTFVDSINPRLKLDIFMERLEGSLNGSEWWHFYHIIHQIMMSRGEKAAEVIQIEERRRKQMNGMKTELIRDIINSKLKNQYKEQTNEIKPDIAKLIKYTINNGKLKLFNQNQQFSALDVKGVHGKSQIYSNRESKQDLDIDRITIENLLDGENYRMVLCPNDNTAYNKSLQDINRGPSMIKCRFKDKFIVVSEAPWRVYDQIEMDIFPSQIQLTRNLYLQFKLFMFDQHYNMRNNQSKNEKGKQGEKGLVAGFKSAAAKDLQNQQQDKKYQLLVPSKYFPKTKMSLIGAVAGTKAQQIAAGQEDAQSVESKGSSLQQNTDDRDSERSFGSKEANHKQGMDKSQVQKMNTKQARGKSAQQSIIQIIATQRDNRTSIDSNTREISHYVAHEQRKHDINSRAQVLAIGVQKNSTMRNAMVVHEFPVFFKYFRMNEISMNITYFHEERSLLNSKDLTIKLAPYISHYKFLPFKRMFDNYESHCKKVFVSQIPNIIKQKFLQAKQRVDEVTNDGVAKSLMQGYSRVKDSVIGHGIVEAQKKKRKERRRRRIMKKIEGAGGSIEQSLWPNGTAQAMNSSRQQNIIGGDRTGSELILDSDSEYDSQNDSDDSSELDDEAKKARQLYLQELRDTKLREARKILFGDFAIL